MGRKYVSLGTLNILRENDYIFLYTGDVEKKDVVAKIEFFLDGNGIYFMKGRQKIYIHRPKTRFHSDEKGIYFMEGRNSIYIAGSTRPIEHPEADYLDISVNVKKEYQEKLTSLQKRESLLARMHVARKAEGEEEPAGKKKGILSRFPKMPVKKANTKAILKEICLRSLDTASVHNPRLAVVQTAHVLRDFFEIWLDLKKEATYDELVNEINRSDLRKDVKDKSMGFFKTMELAYSSDFTMQNFEKMHEIAKDIIKSAE